jgi:CubicO group peptidase (beta-lactamase class C family)
MATIQAYHGVSASEHQARFNQLSAQGFRIISICVCGSPSSPSYAAVWVQRPGPAWQAAHGLTAAQYQAFVDEWSKKGYYPILVSATGAGDAVFATVWQQGNPGPWKARHGISEAEFQSECTSAVANSQIPVSVSIYGDASQRRYAAIWLTSLARWTYHSSDAESAYQAWFNAAVQPPLRPGYVALSKDYTYVSVFRDDAVGPWVAAHSMTAAQYQAAFDAHMKDGLYPICVQAGQNGAAHYAAIFAKQDLPLDRHWTVTGTPVPALANLDDAMKQVMVSKGVRAAALTVGKNGSVLLSRGYTWAESGYPITRPNTLFRLASVSKAFTSAAIYTLLQAGTVHAGDKVFPMLGIKPFKPLPNPPADPRYNDITVQNLIDHLGGFDATLSKFDPVFGSRTIGQAMQLNTYPSKLQMASYMMGRVPLVFAPGTTPNLTDAKGNKRNPYSNFGYVMLGLVVEHATKKSFTDYVKQSVLATLGISDVYLAATLMANRRPNEALAEAPNVVPTALDPNSNALLPVAYGGFVLETMDSGGGLIASVPAVTDLVHHYAAWGAGPRAPSARTGSEDGTRTRTGSLPNGVDYAFAFNTRWNLENAVDAKGTEYIDKFGSDLEAMLNLI